MKNSTNSVKSVLGKSAGTLLASSLVVGLMPAAAFAEAKIAVSAGDASNAGDTPSSFRYEAGNHISADATLVADASTAQDSEHVIRPFAMITDANGHNMFDWFDKFDQGYYTDTDAKKVVDVSEWQRNIDWHQVKASGVDYAIIRCGFGDTTKRDDNYWLQNVKGCQEAGIPFGVYLYSYASTPEYASSEADHVLSCLAKAGLTPDQVGLPIYYDMEDKSMNGADYPALATAFCDKIASYGYEVGVYANMNWWNTRLTDPVFNKWHKWVAAYNASIGLTYKGFSDFKNSKGMWQFSSSGNVPGIPGRCDLNYTYLASVDGAEKGAIEGGRYRIVSAADPSKVLDVVGGSGVNGGNIQLYASNESKAQVFDVAYNGEGFYVIRNCNSGRVLDVAGGSLANGGNVQQYDYNGSYAQQWRIDDNGDGTYTFTSRVSGRVLDLAAGSTANGTNVQQYAKNGSVAQKFRLEAVGAAPGTRSVNEGTYTITSTLSSKGVFDIPGASTADGANVQMYAANGTDAQRYDFVYDGSGYYVIRNVASGKVLDVASGQFNNGANVQQYTSNGTDAQKWRIDRNADGTYTLVSKLSGKAVDIAGGSSRNGANVQVYEGNGTAAQRFRLTTD